MFSYLFGSRETKVEKQANVLVEEEEKEEDYSIIFSIIKKEKTNETINEETIIDNSELFFKLFRNIFIQAIILKHCRLYKTYSNNKPTFENYKEFKEFEFNKYITNLEFKKIDPFQVDGDDDIKIPPSVTSISFSLKELTLKQIKLPGTVTCLSIDKYPVNKPIEMGDIPKSINKLILGENFPTVNRRYSNAKYINSIEFIPPTVKSLVINTSSFGTRCGEIPKTITELDIGSSFVSRVFDRGYLPSNGSLINIRIGNCMNSKQLLPGDIPNTVKILRLNKDFNQILKRGVIPSSVTKVLFDKKSHFNYQLELGSLPSSITVIQFGKSFNQEIKKGIIPQSVTSLSLGYFFNRPFVLPDSLKILKFSVNFNLPLEVGDLPSSLEHLEFGDEFNRPLTKGIIPHGVKYLKLSKYFAQDLKVGDLPSTIETLIFGRFSSKVQLLKSIPTSVTTLDLGYLSDEINVSPIIPSTVKHLKYGYQNFNSQNPIDFTKLSNGMKVTYTYPKSEPIVVVIKRNT